MAGGGESHCAGSHFGPVQFPRRHSTEAASTSWLLLLISLSIVVVHFIIRAGVLIWLPPAVDICSLRFAPLCDF